MSPASSHPAVAASDWSVPASLRRLLLLLWLLFSPALLSAEDLVTADPYKVKAAFLSKFARYVTWPKENLPPEGGVWNIGILGDDPFGDVLDRTLKGRTELQRAFVIHRASTLEDLPSCHIVFVSLKDAETRKKALLTLKTQSVLTVGDEDSFLEDGGVIRFRLKDTLLVDINLDQAQSVSLGIPTKMLEIAGAVLEKGKLRKFR